MYKTFRAARMRGSCPGSVPQADIGQHSRVSLQVYKEVYSMQKL